MCHSGHGQKQRFVAGRGEDSLYATQTSFARGHRRHVRPALRAGSQCRVRAGRRPRLHPQDRPALVLGAGAGRRNRRNRLRQERRSRGADRLDHQADDRDGDPRSRPRPRREDHAQPRGRGADEGLALAPAHRPVADARRAAAARAHVLREPRRRRARPKLSRRHGSLRRRDERQGRGARHEREPLRRAHRPFAGERFHRAATWRRWCAPRTTIR